MLANNISVVVSFLSLFFFCRQQQGQLVYLGYIRIVWAARGVTFQKRFLFKLCVFRKLPCSDLILGIQLSDGISSIKGDRENKSLPSKDGVCLWQGLQMRRLWTSFFMTALWLKMGREERKSAVSWRCFQGNDRQILYLLNAEQLWVSYLHLNIWFSYHLVPSLSYPVISVWT